MAQVLAPENLPKRASLASYRRRLVIARRVKKLRIDAGLDQMQAAVAAGVSLHTWKRWENGSAAIPLERVADIAKAIGTDVIPTIRTQLAAA